MLLTRVLEEGGHQGGVDPNILVGLLVFLVIFFLMVLLGWLASSKGWLRKEEPLPPAHGHDDHEHAGHGAETTSHAEHAHAEMAGHESSPAAQAAPDDLTILEGVGPKVAKVLAGIGITTFAGLEKADRAAVRTALDAAGYKYMDPAGWYDQAALAARGDKEGLQKLQDSLKGGRKAG